METVPRKYQGLIAYGTAPVFPFGIVWSLVQRQFYWQVSAKQRVGRHGGLSSSHSGHSSGKKTSVSKLDLFLDTEGKYRYQWRNIPVQFTYSQI